MKQSDLPSNFVSKTSSPASKSFASLLIPGLTWSTSIDWNWGSPSSCRSRGFPFLVSAAVEQRAEAYLEMKRSKTLDEAGHDDWGIEEDAESWRSIKMMRRWRLELNLWKEEIIKSQIIRSVYILVGYIFLNRNVLWLASTSSVSFETIQNNSRHQVSNDRTWGLNGVHPSLGMYFWVIKELELQRWGNHSMQDLWQGKHFKHVHNIFAKLYPVHHLLSTLPMNCNLKKLPWVMI